jgi:hypothetical protein
MRALWLASTPATATTAEGSGLRTPAALPRLPTHSKSRFKVFPALTGLCAELPGLIPPVFLRFAVLRDAVAAGVVVE